MIYFVCRGVAAQRPEDRLTWEHRFGNKRSSADNLSPGTVWGP